MNGRFLFQTILVLLVLQIVVSYGCRRNRCRKHRCHRNRDCCLPGCCCDDGCCCGSSRDCRYKPRKSHRCRSRCYADDDCCCCGIDKCGSSCCGSSCCGSSCCGSSCCGLNKCGSSCCGLDKCCSHQKSGDTVIITGNNRPGYTCGCCESPMNTCSGGKVIVQSPAVCGCGCPSNPWNYGGIGCGQCDPLCNNGQGKTTIVIKEPTQTVPCC